MTDIDTNQVATIVAAVVAALQSTNDRASTDVEAPRFEAVKVDEPTDDVMEDTGEPRPRGRHAGSSKGTTKIPALPDHITDVVNVDRWIFAQPELFVTDRITRLSGGGQIEKGATFLMWSYVPKYGAKRRTHDGTLRARYDWDTEAWRSRYISDRHIARVGSLRVNDQTPAIGKYPHMGRVFKAAFDSGFYIADKYQPERGPGIWTLVNFKTGVVLDVTFHAKGSFYVRRQPNLTYGSDAWNEYLEEAESYNPNSEIVVE